MTLALKMDLVWAFPIYGYKSGYKSVIKVQRHNHAIQIAHQIGRLGRNRIKTARTVDRKMQPPCLIDKYDTRVTVRDKRDFFGIGSLSPPGKGSYAKSS
jgi:hypothetical protein